MNNIKLGETLANFNMKSVENSKKSEDTKFKDDFSKTLETKCKLYSNKSKTSNLQDSKNGDAEIQKSSNLDINKVKNELKKAGIDEEKLKNITTVENLEKLITEDLLNAQEKDISLDSPEITISIIEALMSSFLDVNNTNNSNNTNKDFTKLKELVTSNVESLINNNNLDSNVKDKLNLFLEGLNNISDNKVHISSPQSFKQSIKEELSLLIKQAKESLNESSNKNAVIFEKYEASLNQDANVVLQNIEQDKDINVIPNNIKKDEDINVISNNVRQDKGNSLNLKDNKLTQEENILEKLSNDSPKDNKIENAVNFMNHLKATVENVQVPQEENIVINKATFANDILKTVKYMEINNLKDLTVKINPKELGEIIIKVTVEGGIMKANIAAQNKEAFNLLNAHLPELNDKLQQNNISIQSLDINIYEDTTFFKGQSEHENAGRQQNKKNKTSSIELQGIDGDEEVNLTEELNKVNLFA